MSTKTERNSTRSWRPALLSVEDVAYELSCSASYVWELHKEGKLPALKMGEKATRWLPKVVDAFIAALPEHPSNAPPWPVGVRKSNAGRSLDSSKK